MDLAVAADPWGGSRVLPGGRRGGGSDTVYGGHGDGGGARARRARLAADMKVGKYGNHFPDDIFVPLAVETYGGCLDSAFDGFLGSDLR
jgi:hypothetical protein